MRKSKIGRLFDIQFFGEGAGGEGGGTGEAAGGQQNAALAQPQTGGKEDLANVVYGKQVEAPAAGEAQTADNDRNARFEALIKGEFKDLYDQRIQDTIKRRLKGNEETVQRYNQLSPVLDLLAGKYGVDAQDIAALTKAIEEDDAFYEDEALERGLSVQQVKQIRKMERENAQLKAQMQQQQSQKQADALYASWMEQSNEVKQVYPSFDLQTELQNEQFRQLLRNNIPIRTAFEVIHKDDIIPAAMQFTARQVEQKVANSVLAGQKRPAEGAMGNRSASRTKSDVSQLTDADMAEINRRVLRGERITF